MRVMAKWLVMVVTCFVMIGIELPPFADAAGKEPVASAPPVSSVPPSGSAISTAGQAYGLCAKGVAAELTYCVRQAGDDASAIEDCVADAAAGAQACHDTFFTSLINAAP
jgi:hypothetical protein